MSRIAIIAPSLLAVCLASHSRAGGIELRFSGDLPVKAGAGYQELKAQPCNGTPDNALVKGWRFKTPSFGDWKTIFYENPTVTGAGPYEYTQAVPDYDQNIAAGNCTTHPAQYYTKIPEGADANPYDAQLLLKQGSCNDPQMPRDAAPIQCVEIPGLQSGAGYYDAHHCILDTLGEGGAANSGSLIASFAGQTQIQAAVSPEYLTVYGWEMRWDPYSLGGPMYMMALAMGQEYLGMNRQWLQTIAGKESNFGYVSKTYPERGSISEWANGNVDSDGSWLPWQVLTGYYSNLIHAYPRNFPAHTCAAGFPGPVLAEPCVGSWEQAIAHYVRTPGLTPSKTGPNSPQLANAVLSVSLAYFWIYDGMWQATDLCYADAVLHGKDKRVALAGIMPLYADGVYTDVSALKARGLRDDPDVFHKIRPGPSADYRDNVFYMLDAFHKANDNSTACGGTVPVYDAAIGWEDVQRFYFGGSGVPGTPAAQGDGGLLLHYDLSATDRGLLLADLRCAFDGLKGKAPSTQGRDAISYRYDWLTMLRSVKARLPLRRENPRQAEWNTWVKDRSRDSLTCAGAPRDASFPGLAIISPRRGARVAPGFAVVFTANDAGPIARTDWTLDPDWRAWTAAESLGGGRYGFTVPCGAPGAPGRGQAGRLWLRIGDGCGNFTYQDFAFTDDSSQACRPDPLPGKIPDPIVIPKPGSDPKSDPDQDAGTGGMIIPRPDIGPGSKPDAPPVAAQDSGSLSVFVTFPNGSAERPSVGSSGPVAGQPLFLPVDARGEVLPGACRDCRAGSGTLFAGPVIHLILPGAAEWSFAIYSTLGEVVARGQGGITEGELTRLARSTHGATSGYEARIVWTGLTNRGGKAATGAYILKAEVRPGAGNAGPRTSPVKRRIVFGLLRA